MKGAMPVPGPTMMTGTKGSFGKWKEFAVRGEMDISGAGAFLPSAGDARVFG